MLQRTLAWDLRYGPVAAPMTASAEPPIPVGQLVPGAQFVNSSYSRDRWACALRRPRDWSPDRPVQRHPAESAVTLHHSHFVGLGITSEWSVEVSATLVSRRSREASIRNVGSSASRSALLVSRTPPGGCRWTGERDPAGETGSCVGCGDR